MAKARQLARAERERLAALAAAEREAAAAREARCRALRRRLTGWLPRRRPASGVLAERRRTQQRLTFAILVALNLLVWLLTRSGAAVALSLVVSVLVAPVLFTMLFRKG